MPSCRFFAYTARTKGETVNTQATNKKPPKESLELDVEALRRQLGPVKVALIERWIREVNGPFDAAIARWVRAESVVLDIGCSRGDPDLPALSTGKVLFGGDVDMPGLRANRIARAVVHAPVTVLPLHLVTKLHLVIPMFRKLGFLFS